MPQVKRGRPPGPAKTLGRKPAKPTSSTHEKSKGRFQKTKPGKKGGDGFNDRQRRAIQLRIEDGLSMDWEIFQKAGYEGNVRTLRISAMEFFRRPDVKIELGKYREMTATRKPTVDKAWVMRNAQMLFDDPKMPFTGKVPILRLLAEMIPGALVPTKMEHSGQITLESWVDAMGGRPEDAPKPHSALPSPPEGSGPILPAEYTRNGEQ